MVKNTTCIHIFLVFSLYSTVQAQHIRHLTWKYEANYIQVKYDLIGQSGQLFDIKMSYKINDTDNKITDGVIIGDYGQAQKAGIGKTFSFKIQELEGKAAFKFQVLLTAAALFDDKRQNYEPDMRYVGNDTIHSFLIARYEITRKEWAIVMKTDNPDVLENYADAAQTAVSVRQLKDFIQRLNDLTGKKYRLPTSTE